MSSLLQHRGQQCPKRGVELLVYLVEWSPLLSPRCDHCGTPAELTPDGLVLASWECSNPKCRRPFWGGCLTKDGKYFRRTAEQWIGVDVSRGTAGVYVPTQHKVDCEPVTLTHSDPSRGTMLVPRLYRIWRKPVGMMGPWVGFKISDETSYPDLSCPIGLFVLPKGAKLLTTEEAVAAWEDQIRWT